MAEMNRNFRINCVRRFLIKTLMNVPLEQTIVQHQNLVLLASTKSPDMNVDAAMVTKILRKVALTLMNAQPKHITVLGRF